MKQILLMACAVMCSISSFAQKTDVDTQYRRNSLYTIMVPDDGLGEAREIVIKTFTDTPIPDKYNDHCLVVRSINLNSITVTPEEVEADSDSSDKSGKKKLGGTLKKGSKLLKSTDTTQSATSDGSDEVVAKLLKYFKENHVGNQLVAKWYDRNDTPVNGSYFDYNLIAERGLQSASQEEIAIAEQTRGGLNKIMDNAAADLIPRTFVMVSRYSYMSADDVIAMISQTANMAGSMAGGKAGAITSTASKVGGAALSSVLKGYFVVTNTYLFQLEWTPELQSEFESTYWTAQDLSTFDASDDYRLKYVGKTFDFAPATLQFTVKGDAAERLIARATVRAMDGAIAKLQRKHDEFKTLATLHINNDQMYAYIGKKEGVNSGDKYEVLEQRMNEDWTVTYERVGTVTVAKNKVWDNRFGAGEEIEGAATGQEDDDIDTSLTSTQFEGKSDKFMEGMLIRQIK